MDYYVADNPSAPSNPTKIHLYADCPPIVGISSKVDRKWLSYAFPVIGLSPDNPDHICKLCKRRKRGEK